MPERDPPIDPLGATEAERRSPRGGGGAPAGTGNATRAERRLPPRPQATATDAGRSPDPLVTPAEALGLAGTRLAHFEVERLLGRGGMGEVYLATDLALDRPVALKVLSRDIAGDERLRERFYREARAQARIQHANVCHIYFIGEQDGLVFFAMEYIDGESLQDRLDREGKLPAAEAIEVCRMAALGLAEAQAHGFTHRDIKPSNLMVDPHGTVKVLDFGIVKQAAEEPAAPALTGEGGALLGTPLYMSPEQAKGEAVDVRSDIYSLGATLHHLVAGAPPFDGDTAMGIVAKHLSETRAPLAPRGRRRAPIDELCDRMMEKRPEERFDDYGELVAAMERASPARHRPAGFWVRSFALALDGLIVSLAALIVFLPIAFFFEVSTSGNWLIASMFPLYIVVCHARWGRTPGKYALDLRVTRQGARAPPTVAQAVVRFAGQWGLAYVAAGAHVAGQWVFAPDNVAVTILFVSHIVTMLLPIADGAIAAWRRPYKRTLWDRLSETEIRYDT